MTPLQPGLEAIVTMTVGADDTAVVLRSGDVEVLATPRVLALCEEATVAALRGALTPDQTSVGSRVELRHLAPSVIGTTVSASAQLVDVVGRRLVFDVRVLEGELIVADGRIQRVIVDRSGFPG